ncbi:GGDEF domain-containing response regulator [Clostridium sp. ZS2-4]|uniref:GGDEF domain-containing response regulator n=1 Tax=Clostridium sp. ZS2-4 TaxID=2987703 RepID=UPI00227BB85D|nr:diguanylate cyclase [Clostridium sp. ZS2-4]MCY6354617.1 diguanylate cyclase [Clostridium sp. ZS2-4]
MLSILHIDNNYFYKRIMKNASIDQSFRYSSANCPAEAFEILENDSIDLIITALEFKDENGENFIKCLNESKYKSIPVIVLTSNDGIESKKKMFELGVIDYLLKDTCMDNLFMDINRFKTKDSIDKRLKDIKIAVLDDSHLELEIIRKIFQLNNITNVDYYSKPDKLLNSTTEYSLYLVDFILPNISGEQVILELRKKYKYSLIVTMSSIDNHKVISNILSSGVDDYIMKPFNENVFMARLKANIRTFLLLEELKLKNSGLKKMIKIDELTELYNYKYIFERLKEEIELSLQGNMELSIAIFDIDNFKSMNDNYGQEIADKILLEVSNKFKEEFKEIGISGRYAGNEFLSIFPKTNLEFAHTLSEQVRKNIETIKIKGLDSPVTISAGIAALNEENVIELIKKAENHLNVAKGNGGNSIES